jgi:hypothetical protein
MELPVNYDSCGTRKRRAVREEYVRVQEGLCYFCSSPLSEEPTPQTKKEYPITPAEIAGRFPVGFLDNPVHLHHDQDTGMTAGAVHAYCNAALWIYMKQ